MNSDDTTTYSGVNLSDQRCWPEATLSLSIQHTSALTTAVRRCRRHRSLDVSVFSEVPSCTVGEERKVRQ